jgi:hypothetical protein
VVETVVACPVALFVTVTFAPLTTAPLWSVMVPWILPVEIVVWAGALAQKIAANDAASKVTRECFGRNEANFICATFLSDLTADCEREMLRTAVNVGLGIAPKYEAFRLSKRRRLSLDERYSCALSN